MSAGFRHALLLANPAAASVTPDLVKLVEDRMSSLAGEVSSFLLTGGDADQTVEVTAAVTAAGETDVVAVLGGDGTVRAVAEGLARGAGHWPDGDGASGEPREGPALLTLPGGSGNSTCRNLWGERDSAEILDLAREPGLSRVRGLDLMRLVEADTGVFLGASSGFLADVLIAARSVDSDVTGRDRYFHGAARVLADMPAYPTRVTVDGVTVHEGPSSVAAVGGGRYRAYAFQFLPRSLLDDGWLDVCAIGELAGPAVGELAALVPQGGHLDRPEVTYTRGRRVVIQRLDGMPLVAEYDGEVWSGCGDTLTVEIMTAALAALTPVASPNG